MSNIPQQSTIHLSSSPSIMPTPSLASSSSSASISSAVDPSTPSVFVPPPPSLQLFTAPPWQDSTSAKNCYSCSTPFGFLATKRHCRIAGHLCCDACTQTRIPLPPLHTDPVAVCKKCWGRIAEAKMNGTLASSNMNSHVPNSPLASSTNESLEDNLSALALMFPEIELELRRDILAAQQNNLARAITFLKSNAGTLMPTIATLTPSNASQQQPGVGVPSASSSSSSVSAVRSSPIPSLHLLAPDHRLTIEQKRFFYHHGFIHLTQVVPIELIQAALGEINDSLGRGINVENYHKSDNRLSYCPDVAKTAVISSLFKNSPIPKLCESLMGAGSFHQPDQGQIALTFPNGSKHGASGPQGYQAAVERWTKPELYSKHWHIDGIHKKSGGFANDEIKNFTLLVGVYLSEVRQDFAGNIAVFPGSHLELEQYFRSVDPLIRLVDDQLPQIRLNKPHQLQVRPGDVLLSHYQTAHLVTPNLSSSIRYAVYFRICHSARGWKYSDKPMKNIWIEYAGMKDIHLEAELNARKERERVEAIERKREQEDMDHRAAMELQRQLNEEERRQQQQQQQNQQPHIHPQPQPHQPSHPHAYPPHIIPAPYATPIPLPPSNSAVDYGNNPMANPFAPPYSHQPYPQHQQSIQTPYLGHPSYAHPSLQSRLQPLPPSHPQQGFAYPGSVAQPQPILPNASNMPNHHPSPLALAPPPGGLHPQLQPNPYQQPRYM